MYEVRISGGTSERVFVYDTLEDARLKYDIERPAAFSIKLVDHTRASSRVILEKRQ